MFFKKLKFIIIILLFYQTPLYSKSITFEDFDTKSLAKYFSGIVAFNNRENSQALKFFNSTKILTVSHDPYLKRYIYSLVLENKVSQAINIIKQNENKSNTNFFKAYLLLFIDSLKKNNFKLAFNFLSEAEKFVEKDRFNQAILESLKQYAYVFKERHFLNEKKKFGSLSSISDTFLRCYLDDPKTDEYFSNLINNNETDFTRYVYFYLTYLIENGRLLEVKEITNEIDFINTTLLLSQGKEWVENGSEQKLAEIFSCKNHNDLISEFLFIVSNLYSSQNNFEESNFYLNLSSFLNPKFIFNLSLVAENYFQNGDYEKAKKIVKNFKKDENFYYWFRVKKEAQIIAKKNNDEKALSYIISIFNKINNPNRKILFDTANFYKKSKNYEEAIKYYTKIIDSLDDSYDIKSDILYRRGGSYERMKNFEEADKDLLHALRINPNDAYILNYLAYSWLERDFKIDKAFEMLEIAYKEKTNDPYIIDSIGWAYYLNDNYFEAEKLLRRAVELMPDDPIVNDHYGDILWKLDRKIQARYFWINVLDMESAEDDMIEKVSIKIVKGL
tara:strand:+ start:1760 stop:3436 length:1677 start_codon:yes stop_codon:yes gene_type:complete